MPRRPPILRPRPPIETCGAAPNDHSNRTGRRPVCHFLILGNISHLSGTDGREILRGFNKTLLDNSTRMRVPDRSSPTRLGWEDSIKPFLTLQHACALQTAPRPLALAGDWPSPHHVEVAVYRGPAERRLRSAVHMISRRDLFISGYNSNGSSNDKALAHLDLQR